MDSDDGPGTAFFPMGVQMPKKNIIFVMAGHTLCLALFVSVGADTNLQPIAYGGGICCPVKACRSQLYTVTLFLCENSVMGWSFIWYLKDGPECFADSFSMRKKEEV